MKEYEVIYADPPWRYSFSRSGSRKIENQYETMEVWDVLDVLASIEVASSAVCYLWATAPKLREALQALEAWRFEYKTCAVWDKQRLGMGYWFRGQHEILLVGTRGKFPPPDPSLRVSSVIHEPRQRHSAKPGIVRELIRGWYPDKRAVELFARCPGDDYWDVWGNEAPGAAS